MSANTKIEWCDHTFNSWEGCQETGPGCDHCYAKAMNARFNHGVAINFGPGAPRRRTSVGNWALPRRWNAQADAFMVQHGRRQRVFALSLGDWADNQIPVEWLVDFLEVVRTTPGLDWLLLTKRIGLVESRLHEANAFIVDNWPAVDAQPLSQWLTNWLEGGFPPANVWLGATVTSQAEADRDIPKLLEMPAKARFLSMEPLLGPVDLSELQSKGMNRAWVDALRGRSASLGGAGPAHDVRRLDWVIVGGESGLGARPMHPDWARSLRDQCTAAGVPFLFKQWGEWTPGENVVRQRGTVATAKWWNDGWSFHGEDLAATDGHIDDEPDLYRVGKKAAGRLLDGREWNEVPA